MKGRALIGGGKAENQDADEGTQRTQPMTARVVELGLQGIMRREMDGDRAPSRTTDLRTRRNCIATESSIGPEEVDGWKVSWRDP